ncbi:MAG: hypothetical protein KDD40_02375, partial [Bdellovibrionales bacterium]|nr:hypothetical protein [Bdellovibrionales bacterium]
MKFILCKILCCFSLLLLSTACSHPNYSNAQPNLNCDVYGGQKNYCPQHTPYIQRAMESCRNS